MYVSSHDPRSGGQRSVIAVVDAFSTARYLPLLIRERGHACLHITSALELRERWERWEPTGRQGDFVSELIHHGELEDIVGAVARHRPHGLVLGRTSGAALVASLGVELGLSPIPPSPALAHEAWRRKVPSQRATYRVNTVSLHGRHRVCDIWRTYPTGQGGHAMGPPDDAQLLERRGDVQDLLVSHLTGQLRAYDVRSGAATAELALTEAGLPKLLALRQGVLDADIPVLAADAVGSGQLEWLTTAMVAPARFRTYATKDYRVRRYAAHVGVRLPETPRRGRPDWPGEGPLRKLRALRSFHAVTTEPLLDASGSFAVVVQLLYEDRRVLEADFATARSLLHRTPVCQEPVDLADQQVHGPWTPIC